ARPALSRGMRLLQPVAVGANQLTNFWLREIIHQCHGSRVVATFLEQYGFLADRWVVIERDDPARAGGDASVLRNLRQRDETQLRVAAGDELVRLRDVFTLHQAPTQAV